MSSTPESEPAPVPDAPAAPEPVTPDPDPAELPVADAAPQQQVGSMACPDDLKPVAAGKQYKGAAPTRMPGAVWRPVPNATAGGMTGHQGVVLHIMEGTLDGTDSWFRNPKAQASAHFGVGKNGTIYQWVSLADRAWHAMAANRTWVGIEHEGHTGDALTAAQVEADARILAWLHENYGISLTATDSPTGKGIGWHGMGGDAWGGHFDCPGGPIKGARAVLDAAAAGDLPKPPPPASLYEPFPGAAFFHTGRHSAVITAMGRRLVEEGCSHYQRGPSPSFTLADQESYAAWQRKYSAAKHLGWSAAACDGIPGKTSWDALKVPRQ